jgi:GT2 family glycosyltransferase
MMHSGTRPRVTVCIVTFQRTAGLARLLDAMTRLVFPRHGPEMSIVVVDNDVERSAEAACQQARARTNWPLRYEVEPRRGIPFVRNKAVACAGQADFVAFLDDDEVPEPCWLDELLDVQARFGADVVTGPTLCSYAEDAPAWVKNGRFYQPPRYATGQRLETAYTGNVLIRAEVFRQVRPLFDERIGLGVGEDVNFFRRVQRAGYTIVWADQAVVTQSMPASRTTARGILQRAFSIGNAHSHLKFDDWPTFAAVLAVLCEASCTFAKGMGLLPLGLFLGKRGFVRSLWHVYRAAGMLVGLMGFRYPYYRMTHGS